MPKGRRGLPAAVKKEIVRTVQGVVYSGPLPTPQDFGKYDEILPGAAERILTMAENQSKHRQKIEVKIVKSNITNEKIGLIFGLIVALSMFSAVVLCAYLKQPIPATIIGTGGIVGLVTAFIKGSKAIRSEKKEK